MGAVLACQEIFCIILRRKPVAGDAIGGGRWIGGRPFEKSPHISVASPGKMLFLSAIQTNLHCTSFLMRRYAWI
jgi:hypothetical protein